MDRKMDRDWQKGIIAYPDPAIEEVDPRFRKYTLGSAAPERLWTGGRWTEGPVWFGDGRYLLWSDIPNNRMMRWLEDTGEVSVFRSPSNNSNGNTRDKNGRLITCEHERRRVTRTEHDGRITVLIDQYQGKKLNAPNDVVVHANGNIWFTDPGYGIMGNYEGYKVALELKEAVYCLNPATGEANSVTIDLQKPNGLCFLPDYSKLYITDTGFSPGKIWVFDVVDGAQLENGRIFYELEASIADGICCDVDGNLWSSSGWGGPDDNGVHVLTPEGDLIGKIHLPEVVSNLCFGGLKRNRLFITASQSIYSIYVETQGV
jgi:gluconolactonase